MQIKAQFKLPLSLGLDSLGLPPSSVISTQNYELRLQLQSNSTKQIHENEGVHVAGEIEQDLLTLKEVESTCTNSHFIPLQPEASGSKTASHINFPFTLSLLSYGQQLTLNSTKHHWKFSLTHISKAKFVRNQQLEAVVNGQKASGLLSMDSTQRILIQRDQTAVPVIGVWTKDIESESECLQVYSQYLMRQYSKKCVFLRGTATYFYAVKISSHKKNPQLYLVEWTENEPIKQQLWPTQHQEKILFDSVQKSSFEFTLRSDEKLPERLMQIECSPIKPSQLNGLWYVNTEERQPDSPRFRQDFEDPQKLALKQKVHEQQAQIEALKAELCWMRQQLRTQSQARTYSKRLTQKDLDLDSLSTNRSATRNQSSNGSSRASGNTSSHEPWERFQLNE